jgi:FixJ family two-component response regulator
MEQRITLHIVDSDSRSRAEQARTAFALGHHAEVYADLAEFVSRAPLEGVVLLHERAFERPLDELFEWLKEQGIWAPLIVCDEEPPIERVVAAIKNGALDYLHLPLEAGRLARSLAHVTLEAETQGKAQQNLVEARRRISQLSKREREVLELLAFGSSNKLIARELSISPRTVEIHRSNMMTKLGAGHAAEAVRLWLESGLESRIADVGRGERRGLSPYRDFDRMLRKRMPGLADGDPDGGPDEEGSPLAPPGKKLG